MKQEMSPKLSPKFSRVLTLLGSVGLASLVSLSVSVTAVRADDDYVPPEQIKVSTPAYKPDSSQFDPPLGVYTYEVSWEGIPAAEAKVSIEQEGLQYKVVSTVRTYSAIDLFYKLRYKAEGLISAIDYSPLKMMINQTENSKVKITEMTFHPNGDIEGSRSQIGKDPTTFKFNSNNFTLDPVSASFVARGADWKIGESREFDTFNGKSRYLIRFTAEDKVQMKVNGQARDVWVITPTVQNLSYPQTAAKLRKASVYVTADTDREILKITSEVFVGSVNTKLVGFEPSPSSSNPTRLASLNGKVLLK